MKVYKVELGKVSVTVNDVWNKSKIYDRLSIVSDGNFGIYISKKEVPALIPLSNNDYWFCVGSLNQEVNIDYSNFKNAVDETISNLTDYINRLVPGDLIDTKPIVINCINELIANGALKFGFTILQNVTDLNNDKYKIIGDFVYVVENGCYYICGKDKIFYRIPTLYVGDNQPSDTIWIDPKNDMDLPAKQNEELPSLILAIKDLQTEVKELNKLRTIGIIPASISGSYRRLIMTTANPEKPEAYKGEVIEEEPDKYIAGGNTTCVTCKIGKAIDFAQNKQDLIDGELIFYSDKGRFGVYYQNKFYLNGQSAGGGGGDGISVDDLYDIKLDYLNFAFEDKYFKVSVNDKGKVITQEQTNAVWGTTADTGNQLAKPDSNKIYISWLLNINSIYCGGDGGDTCLCSHNYVELSNSSPNDISLNGLHLLYTDHTEDGESGYIWKVLHLKGIIKAGSTYVIRGARCNKDKDSLINVSDYDVIWYDNDTKEPIKFKQGKVAFYLCVGDNYQKLIDNKTLKNPWNNNANAIDGYIDSCGFGTNSAAEGNAPLIPDDDNWNNILFVRWFTLEPAKQGNKAYKARKTSALWTYIILDRQTQYLDKNGKSIHYYYDDKRKVSHTPKASYQHKTFFTNKSAFNNKHANYINVTFGIQATDNGSGATRCFNWISVGNYNEYVELRKKGDVNWTKYYSIIEDDINNTDDIKMFIDYYKRFNWTASDGTKVTTHKCIVRNLKAGEYEYRIGRDNDIYYYDEILNFTIKSNDDVTDFSFIQITDQQGFNWQEYTAWIKAAKCIKDNETNYDFLINTGDITQSGNRVNEWLDYYEGKKLLIDKEEMFTIGNNDLCGYNSTDLTDGNDATSKYSHINVLRYFCFECNPKNEYYYFNWHDKKLPIYSLYSFNYGNYHFISLNSEIAIASSKMYEKGNDYTYSGDNTMAEEANANIEKWLKKDISLWGGEISKCIVFMHEMPFTIVVHDFMVNGSTKARVGSHLNTLNKNGQYRFSRIFKELGIRLVIGGHKHTYAISKPIYDAPANYIKDDNTINGSIDLMSNMNKGDDRKPVIQVLNKLPNDPIPDLEHARYEIVDKITAPYYVMCQATGYKLVSNKELPSESTLRIPWLLSYFPSSYNGSAKENVEQHRPTFIRYDFTDNKIIVTPKQIYNIWGVASGKTNFNFNKQLIDVNIVNIAFDKKTTLESDAQHYGVLNENSLTINL